MTDYFLKSRPCNVVPVYTSCGGIKLKLTPHLLGAEPGTGHDLPLQVLAHAMSTIVSAHVQDNGRPRMDSEDGYRIVPSATATSSYMPIVTAFGPLKKNANSSDISDVEE
jgi:hypothetical protein